MVGPETTEVATNENSIDDLVPLHAYVQRWSVDSLAGYGSWSQLQVKGNPANRSIAMVSANFWLAGEAFDAHQPAQVHGAFNSGMDVGKAIYNNIAGNNKAVDIVIIGAGFSGISCAYSIVQCLLNTSSPPIVSMRILEARDRIGGRVNTINLNNISIDVGGSWLQNCNSNSNSLLPIAKSLGLTLIPSDFSSPIFALKNEVDVDKETAFKMITNAVVSVEIAAEKHIACGSDDIPLIDGLQLMPGGFTAPHELAALLDINADSGLDFDQLSFQQALTEPGIGNGDFLIKEGYISILNHFHGVIKEFYGKEIVELNSRVKAIDYTSESSVQLQLHSGNEMIPCDYCVCTVPVPVLKTQIDVTPPFPTHIQMALDTIVLGVNDKIILQFKTRWWPSRPDNNLLRWYNNDPTDPIMGVTDILDLTDIFSDVGLPTIVFFICGQQNISQFYSKYPDESAVVGYCCKILREICRYNT